MHVWEAARGQHTEFSLLRMILCTISCRLGICWESSRLCLTAHNWQTAQGAQPLVNWEPSNRGRNTWPSGPWILLQSLPGTLSATLSSFPTPQLSFWPDPFLGDSLPQSESGAMAQTELCEWLSKIKLCRIHSKQPLTLVKSSFFIYLFYLNSNGNKRGRRLLENLRLWNVDDAIKGVFHGLRCCNYKQSVREAKCYHCV